MAYYCEVNRPLQCVRIMKYFTSNTGTGTQTYIFLIVPVASGLCPTSPYHICNNLGRLKKTTENLTSGLRVKPGTF